MSEFPRLNNPPIVEAVFSIDVDPNPGTNIDFDTAKSLPCEGEWKKKATFSSEFKFDADAEKVKTPSVERTLLGYVLHRPSAEAPREVVDFEFKRLSYHSLPGYEDFDLCLERLHPFWDIYLEHFRPKRSIGCSLRFLNSIKIPSVNFEYLDYLSNPLPVGDKWSPEVASTNTLRTDLGMTFNGGATGRVTTLVRSAATAGAMEVVLDITVKSRETNGSLDFAYLKNMLLELRPLKNKIFFGSITPRALFLFD